jgi:peptidoglycan/LPS O-acetylase OafA/YrhL
MRVKGIDGLRALSALSVFGAHAFIPYMKGGALGVDVFFVISGYVITRALLIEYQTTGRIDIPAFYIRRMLRLWPALLVMIAASVFMFEYPIQAVLPSVFYISNFTLPQHGLELFHTWSLSQEEQFYLLWPPIFLLLLHRKPVVALILASAVTAAWGCFVYLSWSGDFQRIAYRLDWRITPLFIGCTLAFLSEATLKHIGTLWPAAVLMLIGTIISPPQSLAFISPTWCAIPSAILIAKVASDQTGLLTKTLEWKPLVGLGVISYAFYLWHMFGLKLQWAFGGVFGSLVATIGFAWLSWVLIERPIRQNRERIVTSLSRRSVSSQTRYSQS